VDCGREGHQRQQCGLEQRYRKRHPNPAQYHLAGGIPMRISPNYRGAGRPQATVRPASSGPLGFRGLGLSG
jgi:hypothetical protein